jgi:hypothetical protein
MFQPITMIVQPFRGKQGGKAWNGKQEIEDGDIGTWESYDRQVATKVTR